MRSDAQQTALLFFIGAVGAILIALIIAFYVARAVTVPLKKLTSAAYTLSTDKLPALVERLRNPDEADRPLSETLTPIDIQLEGRDRPAGRRLQLDPARDRRGGRGAGRPAPQGHRRHLHQPGPPQPDAPRPPDRVHRSARGQRGRPRPARQPVQARPPRHPHATQRRVAARAGRRRAAPPSWSPGRPRRRGPRRHRRGRGLRPHLSCSPSTTSPSAATSPSTSPTCSPSSWRTPPTSRRRTRWSRSWATAPTSGYIALGDATRASA